jgi:hypothetical protein
MIGNGSINLLTYDIMMGNGSINLLTYDIMIGNGSINLLTCTLILFDTMLLMTLDPTAMLTLYCGDISYDLINTIHD